MPIIDTDRPRLISRAKRKIATLKQTFPSIQIECWSVHGDGKATKDCNYAIDVRNFDANVVSDLNCIAIEVDPYNKNDHSLVRLKF